MQDTEIFNFCYRKNPEPGSRPEWAMVVSLTDLGYLGRTTKNNGNKTHLLSLPPFYSRGVSKWLMTEGEQLGHTKNFELVFIKPPDWMGEVAPLVLQLKAVIFHSLS